jgi:hypothetical protein
MSQEEEFVKFMSRHLVALVYECEVVRNGIVVIERGWVSGFVMTMHGRDFWVTAGHCLNELDKTIENGDIKLLGTCFTDYFGHESKNGWSLPFTYEAGAALAVDNDELCLDYALLPVDSLMVQGFATNGIIAVERKNWVALVGQDFEFVIYKVLGFHKANEAMLNDEANPGMRPVLIALERLESDDEWFWGHLLDEGRVGDIGGMSGGPIFGFLKQGERWTYHVIAVQSGWKSDSRVIWGCSVPRFAESLHSAFDEPEDAGS